MKIAVNGRSVAFDEAGDREGAVAMVWHGFPGTGRQANSFLSVAKDAGFRVLALDRPGYGGSSPSPGADWRCAVEDADAVLRHLNVRACHQIGISGGAPYVRAFAKLYPEATLSVTTVGGLGSLHEATLKDLPWNARAGLSCARFLPLPLVRLLPPLAIRSHGNFEGFLAKLEKKLCPADQEVLANAEVRGQLLKSFEEGLAAGHEGMVLDLLSFWRLSAREFFDLACPWHLWHGLEDRVVTPGMGRGRVPESVWSHAHLLKDHGHYSVPVLLARDILLELRS
jgi:pimeloyl-ACP methyl ester carboxylesterase